MQLSSLVTFDALSIQYKPLIDEALLKYTSFSLNDPRLVLQEAMQYCLSAKGKRIRPLIIFASAGLFQKNLDSVMPLACAVEMLHTYSLIHDDLPAMDNDDYRRGQLTCHKKFGEDIAILTGDTLNTFAFEIIVRELSEHFKPQNILLVVEALAKSCGILGMSGGQILDLKGPKTVFSEDYIRSTHALKTGAIISACVVMPGLLNGVDPKTLLQLKTYGDHLGLLFQMVDDILDVEGDESLIGKTVGKDKEQNKQTLVELLGIEKAKSLAKDEAAIALESLSDLKENYSVVILEDLVHFTLGRNW